MAAVEPQSFFGWLDHDEASAERMRNVFGAFDDKEAIDSLGLGVIRDSISDQLFPGISTIQTRARYFLFVPWICQMIESEGTSSRTFSQRLGELEVALIESLRQVAGPNEGVIGYRARKRLKRFPSSVYWNGLSVFRIRLLPLTLPEYRSVAGRLGAGVGRPDTHDDGESVVHVRRMWDPDLPSRSASFPFEPASLTLESGESEFLASKIAASQPDSMIGELARDLSVDRDHSVPWDVPLAYSSPRLQELIDHGRCFSELMHGAQALYNLLLARRAAQELGWETDDLQQVLVDDLKDWSELIADRHAALAEWIKDEAFWFCIERKARVPSRTRRFVLSWASLAFDDAFLVETSAPAATLVTEREFQLKRSLARLTGLRALENWNGEPFSPGQMTFRWSNARQILDDLQNAEPA